MAIMTTRLLLFSLCLMLVACSAPEADLKENALGLPPLLDRELDHVPDNEYTVLLNTFDNTIAQLEKDPTERKHYLTIATVYISLSRLTGNTTYYNNAAMQVLNKVLSEQPVDKDLEFMAYSYQSIILLSMHQFQDAFTTATKAVALNDKNAGIFGSLVDANVELGRYEQAVAMCDRMLAIRPDIRSYSRASYLRQIHGDNNGAIEAMNLAVEAGAPGEENTEWARVTLGDLLLNVGKLEEAKALYQLALSNRPLYPYAEIGLAKVAKLEANYEQAITHTENAIRTMSETGFIDLLAELYDLKGDQEKAARIRADVIELLRDTEAGEDEKTLVRHNGARELAQAYLSAGQLDEALDHARQDLAQRPDNIDANELLAWIYFRRGDYAQAAKHADKMLATEVKNVNTLYKAGLIYSQAGDAAKGEVLLTEARAISSYIDPLLLEQGKMAMK